MQHSGRAGCRGKGIFAQQCKVRYNTERLEHNRQHGELWDCSCGGAFIWQAMHTKPVSSVTISFSPPSWLTMHGLPDKSASTATIPKLSMLPIMLQSLGIITHFALLSKDTFS